MSPLWTLSKRQPQRTAWSRDRLERQRALYMSGSVDPSSSSTYASGFQSYLAFCQRHGFDIDPTPDTLSFFVTYMSKQHNTKGKLISPRTISSYLSGVANTLEPYFPDVRKHRRHPFVIKTLRGAEKLDGRPITRKRALDDDDLMLLIQRFDMTVDHDTLLFLAICFTLYHGVMRLGECTQPDSTSHQNWRKMTRRRTVKLVAHDNIDTFEFLLPAHKGDPLFHGNLVVIQSRAGLLDPKRIFLRYLASRDTHCGILPNLWSKRDGTIPTRSWFMANLRSIFPNDVGGHSFRSGSATRLALMGVPDDKIKAIGRWSSEAFRIYIRKNPVVLMALVSRKGSLFDILQTEFRD